MEDAIYQDIITLPDGRIAVAHERYDASGQLIGKEYIPQPRLQNPDTATPYSKEAVLSDSTCVEVGVPSTARPVDAFKALGKRLAVAEDTKAHRSWSFTESSVFIVPYDGVYRVDVVGSGGSYSGNLRVYSGAGYAKKEIYLAKGTSIPITVGTNGTTSAFGSYCSAEPGKTYSSNLAPGKHLIEGGAAVGGDLNLDGFPGVFSEYITSGSSGSWFVFNGYPAFPVGVGGFEIGDYEARKTGYGVIDASGIVIVSYLGKDKQ